VTTISDLQEVRVNSVPMLFNRYRPYIAALGADAIHTEHVLLAKDARYTIRYTPFEYVNSAARLVIVGITPGPNQLGAAYNFMRSAIAQSASDDQLLREVKKHASFATATMRPGLIRMLEHFGFDQLLGLSGAHHLWGERHDLLHATSILPHAVYQADKGFSDTFKTILGSPTLSDQFKDHFVPSLQHLPNDALYVGLGPTVVDALDWCADAGLIRREQVVGAFCHPSTQSGSQVDVFLRRRSVSDLSPRDPVRRRAVLLDQLYARTSAGIARLTR